MLTKFMQLEPKDTTILLVKDDKFLVDIFATRLQSAGYNVIIANDGESGLKIATEKRPHLILLDIIMPQMDGYEVLAKLQQQDMTKNIPVILLTNLGHEEDVEKGLKSGAAGYLIKAQYTPSEVINKIKEVLEKYNSTL